MNKGTNTSCRRVVYHPDALFILVDKSLVVFDARHSEERYRRLETVHEYTRENVQRRASVHRRVMHISHTSIGLSSA